MIVIYLKNSLNIIFVSNTNTNKKIKYMLSLVMTCVNLQAMALIYSHSPKNTPTKLQEMYKRKK